MLNSMITAVVLAVLAVLAPTQAIAVEPYGGCDEAWQLPRSAGTDQCRTLGWTVRADLVVGPHGTVRYSTLPVCPDEDYHPDAPECSVNFWASERNGGLSYWVDANGKARYVWPSSPVQQVKGWVNPWHFVHAPLSDALAESGYRSATTRNWERCVTKRTATRQWVACPNGLRKTWSR